MTVEAGWDAQAWIADVSKEPVFMTEQQAQAKQTVPYIVIYDIESHEGGDLENRLVRHDITLYRYTEDGTRNRKIDELLEGSGIRYAYQSDQTESGELIEERYSLDSDIIERKQE